MSEGVKYNSVVSASGRGAVGTISEGKPSL